MADDVDTSAGPPLEERARTILESITEAFFALDRNFRFTYLNRTAERLLRRRHRELVGKSIWEEFPAAQGSDFERHYRHAMTARERAEFVAHHPAPLDRWYAVRVYPSPEGLAVYFEDITDRRRAEEDDRRRRGQMELVVRSANVGVWYCPLPFDELIWDDKVKEHFHLPPEARVTIETFYERLHPDDRERTRAAIAKSIEEKVPYDIDYRTVSPDGARFKWIRALGRAFYGPDGAPIQFDGVTIDTSDRKLAELRVLESEQRYRLATRATNDAIWDWDLVTDEVRWNEAMHERFGHAVATTPAALRSQHVHPADRERVEAGVRAALADPSVEHWRAEYRFWRADGTYADVLDRAFVVRDHRGKAVRMLGAMQDLSDRKRVERDRERMIEAERAARTEAERQGRMKDEFLATLSHELRTPLHAILGWAQIALGKAAPDSDIGRALEIIARNARAQATIIDDLLDMNRILSGKVRLELQPVDLAAVVDATIDTTRPTASAKGVTLSSNLPAEARTTITADPNRLQQVLWNLLSNAIKFTPTGGRVDLEVRIEPSEVVLRVADTGEGIAPEFLPHVFERFRQADASTTRRHGGLGLGLSIVKQVVELHGGRVTAASEGLGRGATFVVTLPRVASLEAATARPTSPAEPVERAPVRVETDLGGLRVLVVDDEPDARALVARLLQERGAVVVTAGSADEALAALERVSFDVLVSDIGMPGQDGYGLLRQIRRRPPESGGGIPAVALTAFARPEDRVHAIAAGFMFHITKPVDAAELVTVVAGAAGRPV